MRRVHELREHANVHGVTLVPERGGFVVANRLVRGLTRLVARHVPVARHDTSACAACTTSVRGTRRGLTQASVQSRKFARDTAARPPQCRGGRHHTEHGLAVERDIVRLSMAYDEGGDVDDQSGGATTLWDPCAVSAVAYMCQHRGWRVVEWQLPVHSPHYNFATALDFLCVDPTTDRLIVVELKATRMRHAHQCYISSAAAPASMSMWARHQLQLYLMVSVLERECNTRVDEALVLRTGADCVNVYPLQRDLCERFVQEIGNDL